MSESNTLERIEAPDGNTIAYCRLPGKGPGVIFLGGFQSDMTGTKASALAAACARTGRAFVRFDYFGHGRSSGAFTDGTIGRWREDALLVLDRLSEGPQILVGSSMGGWIMLLLALARPARIAGLVGVAPAPDFTEKLMWERYSEAVRRTLREDGLYLEPSAYGDAPYAVSWRLIEEGRQHLLLDRLQPIKLSCPVRLLQGTDDQDVPMDYALGLLKKIEAPALTLTLVKGGDHRLSTSADLALLIRTVEDLAAGPEGRSDSPDSEA